MIPSLLHSLRYSLSQDTLRTLTLSTLYVVGALLYGWAIAEPLLKSLE